MRRERSYEVIETHAEIGVTHVWATSKAEALRKVEEARGTEDGYIFYFEPGDPISIEAVLERDRDGKPITRLAPSPV